MAHHPGGPQVVPQLGGLLAPDRAARGDGPRLAEAGLRRQGGADEAGVDALADRAQVPDRPCRAARGRRPRARPRRPRARPSVTASTIRRLRSISSIIVSSIVFAASRYQAVTASCWPIRWQRSSAWSCIAGRPLEVEERDVRRARERDPLAGDARRAHEQLRLAGLEAPGPPPRARRSSRGRAGAARPGSARRAGSCTSRCPANTTSGSSEARKSSIQASAAAPLPRDGEPAQRVELGEPLRAQRRGDLAVELAQVERLLAQPGDHVLLGEPVLALVVERDRARRPGAWRAAAGSTSALARRTKQRRRRCQWIRSSAPMPWKRRAKRAPRAEVLEPAEDPQLRDQLLGVVHHRRAGEREPQRVGRERLSASRRTACVRFARGFLT